MTIMPFGKHKGLPLSDSRIPNDYLEWVFSKARASWLRDDARLELVRRGYPTDWDGPHYGLAPGDLGWDDGDPLAWGSD